MSKHIIVMSLFFFLAGCSTTPEVITKTVKPPAYLLQPCYPVKPSSATLKEIIVLQNDSIEQCNVQLESLRDWKDNDEND